MIPVEIPGVIGVTAVGNLLQKSLIPVTASALPKSRRQEATASFKGRQKLRTAVFCRLIWAAGMRFCKARRWHRRMSQVLRRMLISQFGRMPPDAVQAIITRTADSLIAR